MGDEFQRGPGHPELHRAFPGCVRCIVKCPLVPSADRFLGRLPAQVRQVDEIPFPANIEDREQVAVRQESVVARPNQEVMKRVPAHQPSDRSAQARGTAVPDGSDFRFSGHSSGKDQGSPTQGLRGRRHRDAVEQGLRRESGSSGRAIEKAQEPLHVGEVGTARGHLDRAAVCDAAYLVEDDVGTGWNGRYECFESSQVPRRVVRHRTGFENEAGVVGEAALHMTLDASGLDDLVRQVIPENRLRRIVGGCDRGPSGGRRGIARREPVRHHLLRPSRGHGFLRRASDGTGGDNAWRFADRGLERMCAGTPQVLHSLCVTDHKQFVG